MITHQEKLERIKYLRELISSLDKEISQDSQDTNQNPNINSLEVLRDINLQKQLTKNAYQAQLNYLLKIIKLK